MKQRLLLFVMLFCFFNSNAQIPTTGLIKDYKFTNGALTSDVTPALQAGTTTLVPTGNARTVINDRNAEVDKAISLNGDSFAAGGTNATSVNNFAVSFWVKTNTNDAAKRYIFDQFVQTNPCGWSIALNNGQIVANGQSNYNIDSIYTIGLVAEITSSNIADNAWHHIVFQVKTAITTSWDGSFTHNNAVNTYELYIDSVLQTSTTKILNGAYTPSQTFARRAMNATQQLYIGKSTNVANTDVYTDSIDQIRYYETNLNQTQINILFFEDKPLIPLYVNASATGANNGTSWANAFTSLSTAISNYTLDKEIWVASGTYKPSGTARTSTFNLPSNIKMYGGFNGTETLFSQRNPKTNITILSGDVLGNDNATVTATETTRQDNLYHVITARGNIKDITIDGFTISGGNANGPNNTSGAASGQYYHTRGGAIYINTYTANDNTTVYVSNCVFEKNSGSDTGVAAGYFAGGVNNQSYRLEFDSCIIRNNFSGTNSQVLIAGASGYNWVANSVIKNSLFHNNTSTSGASCLYLTASTTAGGNQNGINVDVINTTFSSNTGVNGNVIRTDNGSNTRFKNCIIYGNGSATPFNSTLGNPVLSNTISQGGQFSGINSDPLFNANFTLQAGSPAIDTGNNASLVTGMNFDLNGNARIVNTTVDMGAYEYDAALSNSDFNLSKDFTAYPNPTNGDLYIQSDDEIAKVILFSLDGRVLLETENTFLKVDHLPEGMYLLSLETINGTQGFQKIIKK